MDTYDDLIRRFMAEDTNRLDNIDESDKPRIIVALEDFAEDERVVDFYLSVASNESEYDLGRIEIFKVFEVKDFVKPEIRNRIARTIRDVLAHDKDDEVRNYAAMAAASYMDIDEVFQEIDQILHDPQMNLNLRWNAFAAVKGNGVSPKAVDSLKRLVAEEEFKQSAARVLSEWS